MASRDDLPGGSPPTTYRGGSPPTTYRGASPPPERLRNANVRIYRRSAGPVQSGPAHAGEWIAEFEPASPPDIDPLMGWTSSGDVLQQVRLTFDSLEAAEAYCTREELPYSVQMPHDHRPKPKNYADNFVPFEDGGPRPIYAH